MPQTNFLVHDREKPEHPDSIVSVLYVDDEEDLLTIGKAFLERSGDFRVDILPSAEQALALPHLHTYDAIVSDYQMPVMDGIEFLKVFREKLPKIPFILFTGRGREEVVIEALNNGADFYLQKGGDPTAQFAELAHKIKRAVMQRKAEHSLFESERRYREVVETQTEFISRFTPDFVHLFVNDAYCRHFGLCREEIIGRVFIPTIPDEDSTIVREFFSLFTPENPDGQIEHRVILPDGSVHWHWRRDHAFFDDNGRITEFQSIGRDISVQRQAIDALKESEEKFRILADTAPIAIILYQDSRLLYVNDHVCRITGYTRDELYTMNFWEILHPDYQETAKTRGLARLRGDAAPARYDVKYFTRSGEEGWADLSAAIIQFRGKRTVLILMVGITERKVMEEELREAYEQLKEADEELQAQMFELDESQKRIRQNEYEYRTILKNLDGAFYRTDLQGNLILISPSFAEQFGYPGTNDIIGMNIRENFYLNPSDRDLFLAKIEKYGKVKDERVTLKRYDGSPVIVSISSHLFKDESGSPSGIEGVIHEITETVRIEEALEKSEEKFREMAERSSDLIIILNSRMSPDYVSPAARRIIQYDPEELVGKPPEFASSTIFSQAGPILMSAVGKTMNGEVVENVEIQVCRKDGVLIPVSLSAVPTIHNGTVDGAQVSMRDITAVRKVEQELKRSEEQYRLLADNVHDVIWTADTELHLTYISPSIEKSLGYTQKEMIGMDFSELVTPESFRKIQTLNEEHAEAMKAGKSLPKKIVLELEFSQRSGNTVWTEMMISPAFDANREFSGFVGVTRDITKRKEAEELLRKSEEQFRSFVENANDIVFSLTPDGTITYIPDKWSTIFGYGNNEVIGNPALRFIHPDDYPRIFDFITRKII
ncbi:MAG: PAS domain S-box protein, partial [Methanomicrobiales archaeon]|nr:PAS domain S-box protein [Methanomicrobiales archaeon]